MSENPQDAYPNPNIYEKCVICKQDTIYKKQSFINSRQFYTDGLGQLCHSCYFATTNISTTCNIDFDDIYEHYVHKPNNY